MAEMSTKKTKKIRKTHIKKSSLWNNFEKNIGNVECVYTANKEKDRFICECCEKPLITSDEGFLVCCNKDTSKSG